MARLSDLAFLRVPASSCNVFDPFLSGHEEVVLDPVEFMDSIVSSLDPYSPELASSELSSTQPSVSSSSPFTSRVEEVPALWCPDDARSKPINPET